MKFKVNDRVVLTDDWINNVTPHFKKYINKDAKILDINYQYNTYIIEIKSDERELEVSEIQIELVEKSILEKSKKEIESELSESDHIYNLFPLQKLLVIRDKFRNGWTPEYDGEYKYDIFYSLKDGLRKINLESCGEIFSFQDKATRDRFYDLYKDEIEQILKTIIL